jgi:hypothetical protein
MYSKMSQAQGPLVLAPFLVPPSPFTECCNPHTRCTAIWLAAVHITSHDSMFENCRLMARDIQRVPNVVVQFQGIIFIKRDMLRTLSIELN